MLCGEKTLVNSWGSGEVAISMICRSWTCDHCRPIRSRQLIRLAIDGKPERFITLTVRPSLGVSPADRAARLARAWRLIVARAKRQLKLPSIEYLAVFEATKRGEPHLHILVRCGFIPQRWLSEQMRQIIGSPIVDIRLVRDPKQAASYIAKYVGKAPHRFATCKRYWHTFKWAPPQPDDEALKPWTQTPWQIDDWPLEHIVKGWRSWGVEVVMLSPELAYYGQAPPFLKDQAPKPADAAA